MNRKSLAFTIVLLLAALAPATAIIGFCARMPCCGHGGSGSLTITTERADCCTTIACYESPSATLSGAVTAPLAIAPSAPSLFTSRVAAAPAPVPIDTSPPRASERLAILSTLII